MGMQALPPAQVEGDKNSQVLTACIQWVHTPSCGGGMAPWTLAAGTGGMMTAAQLFSTSWLLSAWQSCSCRSLPTHIHTCRQRAGRCEWVFEQPVTSMS